MARFTADMITPELVAKFHKRIKEDMERKEAFFKSDLCKRMIDDIKFTVPSVLDSEDVSYFYERVQQHFGWKDITKEQALEFIDAMSWTVGADAFIDCPDESNPFSHSYHLKCGVIVFMMHGQGTHVSIMSVETDPEMYERLKDLIKQPITIEYRYVEKDPWQPAHGHGCDSIAAAKKYCEQMGGKVFRWSTQ